MLLKRQQVIFIVVACTFFVYVRSVSIYSSERYKQDIDGNEIQNAEAACTCWNGKCFIEEGKKVCECPPGYGNYTKSFCKACDCGPNKSCMWIYTGIFSTEKHCFCNPGYIEVNEKCVVGSEKCKNNKDCQNQGTCDTETNRCNCKQGTTGVKCEVIENCVYLNCEEKNAKCIYDVEKEQPTCECKNRNFFYENERCHEKCRSNQNCENGAICDPETNRCSCKPGTTGVKCEVIEKCDYLYCEEKDAKCIYDLENEHPTCECNDKNFFYENGKCLEKCRSNQDCENGGTCDPETNRCICKPGRTGMKCEVIEKCDYLYCEEKDAKCMYDVEKEQPTCECNDKNFFYENEKCHEKCFTDENCVNGGICDPETNRCICKKGTTGENCEVIENCDSLNCEEMSAMCIYDVEKEQPTCECIDKNLFYENEKCHEDPCIYNPCMNEGSCHPSGDGYWCECNEHWQGKQCEEKSPCIYNPCMNGGICHPEGYGFKCECYERWKGETCEEYEPCLSSPCKNEGTCTAEGHAFKCECPAPWMGVTCEEKNPCIYNPCMNGGICHTEGYGFKCECDELWQGERCEEYEPCLSSPCKNEGTCTAEGHGFKCECPAPWMGVACEEKDPCVSIPCKNEGTCTAKGQGFKCECLSPWMGVTCEETLTEPCSSNPCRNRGKCVTEGESFRCKCRNPFYGINCEKEISLCSSKPCQNDGICLQKENSFSCHCKLPYFGVVCEKDPCTENPCQNGGACLQVGYSFKCRCNPPFSGDTCQYDACSDNPCFNGGTCIRDKNSFKCKCKYGYYGTICEKEGYKSTLKEVTESTSEENTSISTNEDMGNFTIGEKNYTETTNESTNFTFNFNMTTIRPGICYRDIDCWNKGICRKSYCECQSGFGGNWCEKNLLCERLQHTCHAMGATCKMAGLNAICDCPLDKMYDPRSGVCEDICDPWKCVHGRCEIDGRTFKCNCEAGYTGYRCSEILTKEIKAERSNVWFPVMASVMVFICLLLTCQLCLLCQNRKLNIQASRGILNETTSSGLKNSRA